MRDVTAWERLPARPARYAAWPERLDPRLLGAPGEAVEVDLLERPVEAGSAKASRTGFGVHVPAAGIASVKLTFK